MKSALFDDILSSVALVLPCPLCENFSSNIVNRYLAFGFNFTDFHNAIEDRRRDQYANLTFAHFSHFIFSTALYYNYMRVLKLFFLSCLRLLNLTLPEFHYLRIFFLIQFFLLLK